MPTQHDPVTKKKKDPIRTPAYTRHNGRYCQAVAYRGEGVGGAQTPPPPRNSEVLTQSNRIAN